MSGMLLSADAGVIQFHLAPLGLPEFAVASDIFSNLKDIIISTVCRYHKTVLSLQSLKDITISTVCRFFSRNKGKSA